MRTLWLLPVLLFSFPAARLPEMTSYYAPAGSHTIFGSAMYPGSITKDTIPVSFWEVRGCAAKGSDPVTKFSPPAENMDYADLLLPGEEGITTSDDSVVYSRYVRHGCCRKATVSIERQGNTISFVEYWTGSICKCMCSSVIRAVIKKLPPGKYQVYAVETGTNPLDDTPNNARDTVMHQTVLLK